MSNLGVFCFVFVLIVTNKRDETSFLNGYDFTRLVRFASLVKLNETQSNLSKITIIGNGWGNSKTILSSFNIKLIHPQHVVESRQNDTDLLKNTNKIMIKYNQFDEDDNDSSISIDENYAVNDHLKLSSSSVNTILNSKNPSITIKTNIVNLGY